MTEMEAVARPARLEPLTEEECWERLASGEVCRVAFVADGRIEIIPVNYAPRGHRLVLSSRPDSLVSRSINGPVAIEVDGWTEQEAWSVVVRGPLLRVTEDDERAPVHTWALPSSEVAPLEVVPIELQGRRFERDADLRRR
jgi:uncharacterized protein